MDKLLIFTYISILLCSCRQDVTQHGGLRTIDVEDCFETEKEMKLSEIADAVEYLELKTPHDIVISRISNIVPGDDFWLVHTRQGIYKFTKNGDFVKQIGRKGQGPDEYINILGIDINPTRKEIIHADSQSILFYDFDGNFLRKTKINDYFFNIVCVDSVLWTPNLCLHIDKYMACALNYSGDTVSAVPNPNFGQQSLNEYYTFASSSELREFSHYKDHVYMKTRSSRDTVYELSGEKWTPYLYLNMGKYLMPIEYEIWYSEKAYDMYASNYWNIPRLEEDDRFFFFTAVRQKQTQRGVNEHDYKFVVYDKNKEEGFVVRSEKDMKLTDDILGGPNFWPRWTTEDYYISTIEWSELSEKIEEGKCTLSPSLQKQFDGWGKDTNQLIILCRKKSKR